MAVMFCIVYNVIMNNIFNEPKSWVVELSAYGTLYVVLLPLAYAQQQGSHIKVDIISSRFSGKWLKAANVTISVLSLFYFVILTWGMAHYTEEHFYDRSLGNLDLRLFPVMVVMPVGAFLISIQLFIEFIRNIAAFFPQAKEDS